MKVERAHIDYSWFQLSLMERFVDAQEFYARVRKTRTLHWLNYNYRGTKSHRSNSRIFPVDEYFRIGAFYELHCLLIAILIGSACGQSLLFWIFAHKGIGTVWCLINGAANLSVAVFIAFRLKRLLNNSVELKWTTVNFQLRVIELLHFLKADLDHIEVLEGSAFDTVKNDVPRPIKDLCIGNIADSAWLIVRAEYMLKRGPGWEKLLFDAADKPAPMSTVESWKQWLKADFDLIEECGLIREDNDLRSYYRDAENNLAKVLASRTPVEAAVD